MTLTGGGLTVGHLPWEQASVGATPALPTKRCCKCKISKPVSDYHKRSAGRLQSICKPCRKVVDRNYLVANRARVLATKREYQRAYQDFFRSLKDGPCSDCYGRFHPEAMHWDHLPGQVKVMAISAMIKERMSRESILSEISKCDLVCANCHAVRTWNRRNSNAT